MPTNTRQIIMNTSQNMHLLGELKEFIRENFGNPPNTPLLDIPIIHLLCDKDTVIMLIDNNTDNIIGCIRYHYLGEFYNSSNEHIYCVDCFTVDNKWRRRGIGDYLLNSLHNYVNEHNIPYSMFLKEGKNLSIVHPPLYTGIYVFRELNNSTISTISTNVLSLNLKQAFRIIELFCELNKSTFIIRNNAGTNQYWKLYRKDTYIVLVCFQDAFQTFIESGVTKRICWATGWLESPNMNDSYREEASKELSSMMYPDFDYVWMNKEWIGQNTDNIWKTDGLFHWYLYQWSTNININHNYCITT